MSGIHAKTERDSHQAQIAFLKEKIRLRDEVISWRDRTIDDQKGWLVVRGVRLDLAQEAAEDRGAMNDKLMVENTILRADLKAAERRIEFLEGLVETRDDTPRDILDWQKGEK